MEQTPPHPPSGFTLGLNLLAFSQNALASLVPPLTARLFCYKNVTLKEDFSTSVTETLIEIPISVHPATISELRYIDGLTQQNDMRMIYAPAIIETLNRPLQAGGDRLQFLDATWLVTRKIEEWTQAPWTKFLVTRQMT